MRQNESQNNGMLPAGSNGNNPTNHDAVLVGLITGVTSAVLAEHARELSNRTLEPVVQYVYVPTGAEISVLRRYWIAGYPPSVNMIAQNPVCACATIAADVIRSAAGHLDAGFTTIDAVLPPGADAGNICQRINDQTGLAMSHLRVVLDAAVDRVILTAPNGGDTTAIALVGHLNLLAQSSDPHGRCSRQSDVQRCGRCRAPRRRRAPACAPSAGWQAIDRCC